MEERGREGEREGRGREREGRGREGEREGGREEFKDMGAIMYVETLAPRSYCTIYAHTNPFMSIMCCF